jgi:pimeloyl-ACP methyl ester carboxylesterase
MIRNLQIGGHAVAVAETGSGDPLLYLHGFADIHGSSNDWLPFHRGLAVELRVVAPAHPGCNASDENDEIDTIDDTVFHYLQLLDALGFDRFHLAGASIGGWIAAELAIRIPERVRSLTLIGASGLFVPRHAIADIFMLVQARNGNDYADFRRTLFRQADAPEALVMFPNGRMPAERELLRYRMFRFASRIGFAPPYLHNRKLRDRLHRFAGPAVVIAGERDGLVPVAHAHAYAEALPNAELKMIAAAGNSIAVERPDEVAAVVLSCVRRAAMAAPARPSHGDREVGPDPVSIPRRLAGEAKGGGV